MPSGSLHGSETMSDVADIKDARIKELETSLSLIREEFRRERIARLQAEMALLQSTVMMAQERLPALQAELQAAYKDSKDAPASN